MLMVQCTGITKGSISENLEVQDFRLPKSLVPTHYKLRLQPILDETPGFTRFTAPGSVTITVNCTEDTSTIKLNALDITILESSVVVSLSGRININYSVIHAMISFSKNARNQIHEKLSGNVWSFRYCNIFYW